MDAKRWDRLLPLAVLLFALLIRLPGLGWGLKNDFRNASLHPDETPNFLYSRAVVPALGRFTPGFYSYGTLYLSTISLASDVASGYTGGPKNKEGGVPPDPRRADWDWISRCILAGRVVSLLAGAATALIAFALARTIAGPVAGVLAGAFIALAPAHVVHSRFQTPDVLATALIGGALYFAVRALDPKDEKARLSPATWCGLLAGLSASVKYTGILALLALYVALAIRKPEGWVRQAVVGTLVAVLAFLLTTPGVLLETDKFLRDFTYELRHTATGQELFFAGTANGFVFHLLNLFIGIGPLLVVMGLGGLGFAVFRRYPWALVLLAFWLPYYVLIGRAEVKYMRYTFPLDLALAVGFGYAVVAAQRRNLWRQGAVVGSILGFGGIPGGGLRDTLTLTVGMMAEDPRDAAARDLKTQGGTVGLARDPWYWTPSVIPDGAISRFWPWPPAMPTWPLLRDEIAASSSPKVMYPTTSEGGQTYFDLRLFEAKPDRIVTTNFETDYPARLRGRTDLKDDERARVEAANAWIDRLKAEYGVERVNGVVGYGIEDMDYVRPQVIVWKRKTP